MNKQIEAGKFRQNRKNEPAPKGLGAEVKRQDKIAANRKQVIPTVREAIATRITSKLFQLSQGLPSTGHSMGNYRRVTYGKFTASNNMLCREYSHSCRFKATHGSIEIELTREQYHTAQVIGGILTFIKQTRSRIKPATWVEREGIQRTARLVIKQGFLVDNYHAKTKEEARQWLSQNQITKKQLNQKVGYKDARAAGLCVPGIQDFCQKANINPDKKYKLADIVRLADKFGVGQFARKMVQI